MIDLKDLGFTQDPFTLVPPSGPTVRWLGRPRVKERLKAISTLWSLSPASSIYLVWAELGAGKTHALRYLQGLAVASDSDSVVVYASMPSAANGFASLHRTIVERIPEGTLVDAVESLRSTHGSSWLLAPELDGDRETARVLWHLRETLTQEASDLARKWLRGERLYAAETRQLGGMPWLRTDEDAVRCLSTITRLLNASGHRLIVLMDEFQRIGESNSADARRVNTGLHSLYNACPTGFGLVLSYSIGDASAMDHLISPELRSRVSDTLSLPGMSTHEAAEFAEELLDECRTSEGQRLFNEDALANALASAAGSEEAGLIPREIIRALQRPFHRALVEGDLTWIPIDSEVLLRLDDSGPAP